MKPFTGQDSTGDEWKRVVPVMIRHMIGQFLAHPSEFLSFERLSRLMNDIPTDVLHAVAEQRRDLFVIARNDRALKLFWEAVERIVHDGIERAVEEVGPVPDSVRTGHGRDRCQHYSDEEIIPDLLGCSLSYDVLTSSCCWREICRLRALHRDAVDDERWREICRIRGYLLARQNPRGF